MPHTRKTHARKTTPPPPSGDDRLDQSLDEALAETFPASDPIAPATREKLPPADAPGSDVSDQ